MSNYAKVNLLELDDSVGDRAPEIEGRFGRTKLGVARPRREPLALRARVPRPAGHRHREQEEAYVVVAGSGRVLLDGEVLELRAVGRRPRRARGRARLRGGPDGLEVIAVGGPKPEGGDGEPAPAEWPG